MKNRLDYTRAISIVSSVMSEWDPFSLLAGGAPRDEFDAEIAKVAARIPHIRTPEDAASVLSVVLSHAFGEELFTSQDCSAQGAILFRRLADAGLLNLQQ